MILQSGKIYQRHYFSDSMMLPTLQIKGTAQIYVSNQGTKPQSISEMVLEEDFENDAINTVIAMTRWIAAVYDTGSTVYEMGLVESPYIAKKAHQDIENQVATKEAQTGLIRPLREMVLAENSGASDYVKSKAQEIEELAAQLRD